MACEKYENHTKHQGPGTSLKTARARHISCYARKYIARGRTGLESPTVGSHRVNTVHRLLYFSLSLEPGTLQGSAGGGVETSGKWVRPSLAASQGEGGCRLGGARGEGGGEGGGEVGGESSFAGRPSLLQDRVSFRKPASAVIFVQCARSVFRHPSW